jgi:hypothetical protein
MVENRLSVPRTGRRARSTVAVAILLAAIAAGCASSSADTPGTEAWRSQAHVYYEKIGPILSEMSLMSDTVVLYTNALPNVTPAMRDRAAVTPARLQRLYDELGAIVPPAGLERSHESLLRAIALDRDAAQASYAGTAGGALGRGSIVEAVRLKAEADREMEALNAMNEVIYSKYIDPAK